MVTYHFNSTTIIIILIIIITLIIIIIAVVVAEQRDAFPKLRFPALRLCPTYNGSFSATFRGCDTEPRVLHASVEHVTERERLTPGKARGRVFKKRHCCLNVRSLCRDLCVDVLFSLRFPLPNVTNIGGYPAACSNHITPFKFYYLNPSKESRFCTCRARKSHF